MTTLTGLFLLLHIWLLLRFGYFDEVMTFFKQKKNFQLL